VEIDGRQYLTYCCENARNQTRFRIPPGYKVFRESIAILLLTNDLICSVCVLKRETKALPPPQKNARKEN
jgi:hypothetical protein